MPNQGRREAHRGAKHSFVKETRGATTCPVTLGTFYFSYVHLFSKVEWSGSEEIDSAGIEEKLSTEVASRKLGKLAATSQI